MNLLHYKLPSHPHPLLHEFLQIYPCLARTTGHSSSNPLFMGTAFVEIIKERKACEFSGWGTACFLCHFSLINQRCSQVDTALCVSLSPVQQRRVSALRPTHWGKGEGNHQSSRLHMSAVIPSPFRWLSLSPPVFGISTEAAAQMDQNHCPCHLPWSDHHF